MDQILDSEPLLTPLKNIETWGTIKLDTCPVSTMALGFLDVANMTSQYANDVIILQLERH